MGIPPLPDPEWLQAGALAGALDSPCGGTLDFFHFFHFFDFFFEKPKKIKKINNSFWIFLIFFEKAKKRKKIKEIKNLKKNPGPWVSPRGGFLAVGIPPLPDPEWLQAGALAGALDCPGGGTLDFFDFFRFLAVFWPFRKKSKKSINFF